MTDIVERLKYSLSASYSELRKEAALEIMRLRAKVEQMERHEPSEQDASVRKAWARFSHELHRSPDAPYPGMADAFEQHFSQSFIDREWRAEAATWAAAWKAAKRHGAQPAPSVPEVTDAMALAFHHALTDGSIGAREVEEIKDALRAALAAAPKLEGE